MKLNRLPCWQCSLSKFLTENRRRRFVYGSFDCCLFVCDAIWVMTGADVGAKFRGAYSSHKEARRYGSVRSIAGEVTAEFEMPEVPVFHAQRGDVALIPRARDFSLGIVDLDGVSLAVLRRSGIFRIPLTQAVRAWRV